MTAADKLDLDVVIFGGGAAGLWLLDELLRHGHRTLLLEAHALGCGQTISSQGIIHGGFKYALDGLMRDSAAAIRDMPQIWRDCLAGRREPNLSRTQLRAPHCHLWRTDSLRSRIGMIGAKVGLRVAPKSIGDDDRPEVLRDCPGDVVRLDEQVVEPGSFLADLAMQRREHILHIDATNGLEFSTSDAKRVNEVLLTNPQSAVQLCLRPRWTVLAAGGGNAALRRQLGLHVEAMQSRPLHMVMARGPADALPALNGHCVDGAATRVTITTTHDSAGRTIWQIGGLVSEAGVAMNARDVCAFARRELEHVLGRLDWGGVEWAGYRVDRAEGKTRGWMRPDDVTIHREEDVLTVWPTKLALVPRLADLVAAVVESTPPASARGDRVGSGRFDMASLTNWPRPEVSPPPWETCTTWFPDV